MNWLLFGIGFVITEIFFFLFLSILSRKEIKEIWIPIKLASIMAGAVFVVGADILYTKGWLLEVSLTIAAIIIFFMANGYAAHRIAERKRR